MEESIVKVEHLSHRYSVQWAIRDINFEITENGIYGLLGSNGAGKSTTMNIMCGVLKQTEGEVFIKGVSMRENPVEAKRYIGFLPQKPPLYNDLTVEEFLAFTANIRRIPTGEVAEAIKVVMGRCGLSHFRKRLVRNLSGGYQQRLGIAQAIIHNPAFVVLDEPTNGLDPSGIQEMRELIRSLPSRYGMTVIVSEHYEADSFDAQHFVSTVFAHPDRPTAIINQANASVLSQVLMALHDAGMSIPQDVSVLSCGTYFEGEPTRFPITEMPVMPEELCAEAMYLLVSAIEEHTDIKGSVELIEPAMKRRGSVAEAGSGGTI